MEAAYRFLPNNRGAAALASLGIIRSLEGALLVMITSVFEQSTASIGLVRSKLSSGLFRGLIWSAWFGIAAGVLYVALVAMDIDALKFVRGEKLSSWKHLVFLLLVGGIIGPITEEIFFRGIIYGFIRQWGVLTAVCLSTLIFVLFHPSGGSLPVTQIIGGMVFAFAYEKERNLIAPITIHCLGNLAIFSLTIIV